MNSDTLTGLIALHCCLARMDGHRMDKKAMRFNKMADYCLLFNDPAQGIEEAVSSAIVGDAMHIEGTPLDATAYKWMVCDKHHEPE